jgi:hypothetical protein
MVGLFNTTNMDNKNPESMDLLLAEIKAIKGCENFTDEQAQEILHSLDTLADIMLVRLDLKKSHSVDNQLVVYLESETKNKAA